MRTLQAVKEIVKLNLDIKDKKILSLLSSNSRIPLTILSKKVGLSRDAVNYRIKNYEKNGLIQGYRTIVDMKSLGYNANHLFIKLNNPSKEIETKIITKLIKYPFVRAVIKFTSNFDYEIAFITKDIYDLDDVLTKIISCCSGFIQDYELLTISKTFISETFPKGFSEDKIEEAQKSRETKKLDDKDLKILKLISEDALLQLYEIASKIHLSTDGVSYRIKNMINNGTILKFVPVINYSALNYSLYTVLLSINDLDLDNENKLRDFLKTNKNTLWAVKTIGKYNVLIYVLVKDIEDLYNTIIDLRSLFPNKINNYETLIAYEEYKYTSFPKDLF